MPATDRRVCLLTGASGTLGSQFCRGYASKFAIAAVYRSRPPAVPSQEQRFIDPLEPSARLRANDHPVFAIQADLRDDNAIARIVDLVLARFGRIDLLVNMAVHKVLRPMIEQRQMLETMDEQFHVNVVVPAKLALAVVERFWRNRTAENAAMNRNVVNLSSTSGLYVFPNCGQSGYGSSKAALNYLSCHMASEFDPIKVRVNALAPAGFPQTIPTEVVASAIVKLDEGSLNGSIVVLDSDGERVIV